MVCKAPGWLSSPLIFSGAGVYVAQLSIQARSSPNQRLAMKLLPSPGACAAALAGLGPALPLAQEPVQLLTPPTAATVVEMGPHHRVWSRTELVPDGMGGWRADERRVTELATGLGRWDEGQQACVPAWAAFEVTGSGHPIARQTAHQLILPPDLTESEVDMLAPDGVSVDGVDGVPLVPRRDRDRTTDAGQGVGGREREAGVVKAAAPA